MFARLEQRVAIEILPSDRAKLSKLSEKLRVVHAELQECDELLTRLEEMPWLEWCPLVASGEVFLSPSSFKHVADLLHAHPNSKGEDGNPSPNILPL